MFELLEHYSAAINTIVVAMGLLNIWTGNRAWGTGMIVWAWLSAFVRWQASA